MKITVKKNLIVFHKPDEWNIIMTHLEKEYGTSIRISWRMQRELGFTVRHHKGLALHNDPDELMIVADKWKYHYEEQIHLDFFKESSQSWFQLKYLNE